MSTNQRKAAYLRRLYTLREQIEEHLKCSRAVLNDFAKEHNSPYTWDDVIKELSITISLLESSGS